MSDEATSEPAETPGKIKIRRRQPEPLHDRILVQRIEKVQRRSPIITDQSDQKDPSTEGKVLSVGPGKLLQDGTRIPIAVKPGDVVVFGMYAGTDITMDDEPYLLMREDEIMAVAREVEIEIDLNEGLGEEEGDQ